MVVHVCYYYDLLQKICQEEEVVVVVCHPAWKASCVGKETGKWVADILYCV